MLDIGELRSFLAYDPATGEFAWKSHPHNMNRASGPAGAIGVRGYRYIKFMGRRMPAHRLAWALHYGEWPPLGIDHINRVRSDNRICNLRLANHTQNAGNTAPIEGAISPFKGVSFHKRSHRWRAQIRMGGNKKHLGIFLDEVAAARAYDAAALEHFGAYAYLNFPGSEEAHG